MRTSPVNPITFSKCLKMRADNIAILILQTSSIYKTRTEVYYLEFVLSLLSGEIMQPKFFRDWKYVFVVTIILEVIGILFNFSQRTSLGYDKFLHLLGDVDCGIFGVFIAYHYANYLEFHGNGGFRLNDKVRIVLILATESALLIGILYEVAQAYLPFLRDASDYNWDDTIRDVIFDAIGGVIAGFWYKIKFLEK